MDKVHRTAFLIETCQVEIQAERRREESPISFAERSKERTAVGALLGGLCLSPLWSLSSVQPLKCLVRWDGSSGYVEIHLQSRFSSQKWHKSWPLAFGPTLEQVHGVIRAWGLAVSSVAGQMDLFSQGAAPFDADSQQ